jgi:ribosomal protein L7/L12
MSFSSEAKKEVERLLQQGQKLQAIKYLTDNFQISLEEAKMLVETVENQVNPSGTLTTSPQIENSINQTALDGQLKADVIRLLQVNKKIEAVKLVKTELNTGLKEALVMVEEVQKEIDPNYRSVKIGSGCFGGGLTLFKVIFGLIGITFLCVAGGVYYFQKKTIDNSDLVTGKVTELFHNNKGLSAPLIEYQVQGKTHVYRSSTYSSPPAYEVDEMVEMYVNRNNPDDVVVNTFSDRWFLIFIFGLLGSVFTAVAIGVMFVKRSLKV